MVHQPAEYHDPQQPWWHSEQDGDVEVKSNRIDWLAPVKPTYTKIPKGVPPVPLGIFMLRQYIAVPSKCGGRCATESRYLTIPFSSFIVEFRWSSIKIIKSFAKEVRSHVSLVPTEYPLLCECIRRLHAVKLRLRFPVD